MDKGLELLFVHAFAKGDDIKFLKKFCALVEEYTRWNKFYGKVKVIDTKAYGFDCDPYVIHNCREEIEPRIEKGLDFVEWITDVLKESEDQIYIYQFWFERLLEILMEV